MLLGLGAGGISLGTHWLLRNHLMNRAKEAVEVEMRRLLALPGLNEVVAEIKYAVLVSRETPGSPFLYLLAHQNGRCWLVARSEPQRCVVGHFLNWPDLDFGEDAWAEGALAMTPDRSARVVAKSSALPVGGKLLVGRLLEDEQALVSRLLNISAIGAGLLFLIGGGAAYWVSRRFLQRLERINQTCAEIGVRDLSARVEVGRENDEFARLAQNINAMLDRIADLMLQLKTFTDGVAHDLQTPLARARSRLETMMASTSTSATRADLGQVAHELDSVLATFRHLLELARIEATDRASFREFDLAVVAQDVADLYGPVAEDKDLRFSAEIAPTTMSGREPSIRQLLLNLVDNAVKFTPAGGAVRVGVRSYDGLAELEVRDTGPGIPPTDRQRVFERFARGVGAEGQPGFGMGLSLVEAVVRQHDGDISLEDGAPGLLVRVRIPIDPRSQSGDHTQHVAQGGSVQGINPSDRYACGR
jgi:signal transduction histidine kinase